MLQASIIPRLANRLDIRPTLCRIDNTYHDSKNGYSDARNQSRSEDICHHKKYRECRKIRNRPGPLETQDTHIPCTCPASHNHDRESTRARIRT